VGDDGAVDQDGGGPMASARDLLERFRPAGTPGAAAPAGVPYDRGAALEDELRPVLALLSPTEERCAAQVHEAGASAEQVLAAAEEWALRAALLAGSDALRPPYGDADARVEVTWSAVMGARFPSGARVELPPTRPGGALPATSAVLCATTAYGQALSAAVDAAVALGAARALEEEVAATRFRLRAVQDRWVPRLEEAAAALDLALAEAEGADAVRLRLAAPRGNDTLPGPIPSG
jgi:V/A-type H+/Na+-transporting ATPase subunit D